MKNLKKTNRRPFQREHLQNRSEPEIALFCYTVDKFTLPKTEKQPPRTHPESAIRHQFRFKSLLKFEWSKLKTVTKRSYLHYLHVIDLQNPGVETFMKNSKKRSRLLHPHHRPNAKIALFRYTVCKYVIFRGASMPPSLALNGRSWALNGLLGPSVGSLGSSIAPLGPDLLNKKYDC